jgi:hypothetical protein
MGVRVGFNIANVNTIPNLIRTADQDEKKALHNSKQVRIPQWQPTVNITTFTFRSFTSKYFDEAELIMKAKPKTTPLIDKNRASGSNPSRLTIIVITIP